MATPVGELDLPTYDPIRALGRDGAIEALSRFEGHWLIEAPVGYQVIRHEDVVALLRDRRLHNAVSLLPQLRGVTNEEFLQRDRQSILSMEGEGHDRLRRLVAPAFSPKSADRLRPFMREVINELVDPVAGTGRAEFVADISEPYPIPIICELLGAPREDWQLFSRLAEDVLSVFDEDMNDKLDVIMAAQKELDDYIAELIGQRRAAPRDDLLSDLIAAEEEGDRLSSAEVVSMAQAVLVAGTDTTRNQLATAIAVFAEHPDQWALLADEPERAGPAVEEIMRFHGAVWATGRIASEDIEYRDVLFPAGTLLFPSLLAANHDETVWDDAGDFDITRDRPAPQMTFGSGIHFCLGAALARAELQEALPLLARRMPDLALDGEVEWKPAAAAIRGPARLPIRFGAGH